MNAAGLAKLSPRERQVFCGIIHGATSEEIAGSLGISVKTVETHRSHIHRKMGGTKNALGLVLAAGLLSRRAPLSKHSEFWEKP